MLMDSGVCRVCKIERAGAGMPRQLPFDHVAIADEQQSNLEMTRGDECTVNNRSRAVVTAHRIDGNAHSMHSLQ